MTARGRIAVGALLVAACLLAGGLRADPAAAHPLDQLTQHLMLRLEPTGARVSVAIGGGILANERVLEDLDHDGDGTISAAEQRGWLEEWLGALHVALDGQTVPVDPAAVALTVPPVEDFHVGFSPIIAAFAVAIPAGIGAGDHRLAIRNDYLLDRTDFRLDVEETAGAALVDRSWPGRSMRVVFAADPSVAAGAHADTERAARAWGSGGVAGKVRGLLERPKTPGFVLTLVGIFAVMGALHAVQPGHGKTLVAAYLVAAGGRPRHAFALAGIVTFTHTVSVFLLGAATLAASELFLPSRVIPVMGALSGLLVAAMGLAMLRGALRRRRPAADHGLHVHGGRAHSHGRDHAALSDEEHARLHLDEAMAARRGVSRRGLVGLGVSGGLAPCPDALAILLLAIGMNQAGLGMLAIVAFSAGLAAVLVAFGLAIALAGPAWGRAKAFTGARPGWGAAFNRAAAASPALSAAIVLLLGLAMAWRSLAVG